MKIQRAFGGFVQPAFTGYQVLSFRTNDSTGEISPESITPESIKGFLCQAGLKPGYTTWRCQEDWSFGDAAKRVPILVGIDPTGYTQAIHVFYEESHLSPDAQRTLFNKIKMALASVKEKLGQNCIASGSLQPPTGGISGLRWTEHQPRLPIFRRLLGTVQAHYTNTLTQGDSVVYINCRNGDARLAPVSDLVVKPTESFWEKLSKLAGLISTLGLPFLSQPNTEKPDKQKV